MRVLIVGCGSIGRRHLSNLRALREAEVVAWRRPGGVADPELERLGVSTVASLAAGLATRPDFAIVANPTALHLETALQLVEAGVPLFLEKPVSDRREGLQRLVDSARARRLLVFVAYNLRFHPGLLQLKRWLDEGRIGRPLACRAEVGQYLPDWHPDRDYRRGGSARRELGGGALLDLSHELDLVRWLLGPVRELTAIADRVSALEIDTEDVAEIAMRLASGAVASVHLDYLERAPLRRCRIAGSEGSAEWDYHSGRARLFLAATGEWSETDSDGFERNDMYRAEMAHFLECLESGTPPAVSLADGVAALELALAARRSSEERAVVVVEEVR